MRTIGVYEIHGADVDPCRDALLRTFPFEEGEKAQAYCKALNRSQRGRHYVNDIRPEGEPDSVPPYTQAAILRHSPDGTEHAVRFETDPERAQAVADDLNQWSALGRIGYSYSVSTERTRL